MVAVTGFDVRIRNTALMDSSTRLRRKPMRKNKLTKVEMTILDR